EYHGYIPAMERETPSADNQGKVFGEVAKQWAKLIKVEETTFELYRRLMNVYVLPHFGNKPIESITSLDIEIFVSRMKCGTKYKRNILTPFRLVMGYAKKHKMIQDNPFDNVSPLKKFISEKVREVEKETLDLMEIHKFIEAVDDFWKPLFTVLFFTGLRVEELAGLKWKRICFRQGVIKIREVLVHLKGGKMLIKPPKTKSSIRDIKLSGIVIDALRKQRERTWKGVGDDFVFLNKVGRPIRDNTLNQKVFHKTLKKIGVAKKVSLRDTRSSYMTNALDKNERVSFIVRQVGHSNSNMLIQHYYRHTPASEDGENLEKAWNSTRILPDQASSDLEVIDNT
ncbi:MAG: tyrosine-type recombinase/integrase, partial [Desulfosalsimonadaceae bacterium]